MCKRTKRSLKIHRDVWNVFKKLLKMCKIIWISLKTHRDVFFSKISLRCVKDKNIFENPQRCLKCLKKYV